MRALSRLSAALLCVVLLSACGESPTSPTRIEYNPAIKAARIASSFDAQQLGHASVTNPSESAHTVTLIVWDATALSNQKDVAHFTRTVQPGETADLTVALTVDPCVRYQRDLYLDLPAADRYTLSDVGNYFLAAPGVLWGPLSACRNPPSPPLPPVIVTPQCLGCPPPPPPPPVPACVSPGTFTFPAGSSIARFPIGYPMPWLPEAIGPFAFSVPSGLWHITAVTGDDHSGKNDGTQAHEIGIFELSINQVLGPTLDIPDDQNSIVTDFGTRAIKGFNSFRFVHAGPTDPAEPTDSFYPTSITFACP